MAFWVFEKLAGAAVRRDPNETQLFKTEQTEEGEYAGTDALVREILQNSMDASLGQGPVRLRLAIHSHAELPEPERLAHYFERLRSPLRHRDIELDEGGVPLLNSGFLVCEDFGTCGLAGNPLLAKDPIPGSQQREDFFWFWRNIGRSGKTGEDLGRWGLGKTVYRAASQIGCMLGLTVRQTDSRQLLMGQAVLKIHEHDGAEYVPEGYWCGELNEDGLPLPIEDEDEVEQFRTEWKLSRQPDQPGLSVVVPYVAPELQPRKLLQALCVHFFVPILQGRLEVDLVTPDPDLREVRLSARTLLDRCQSMVWDGPKRTKRHTAPPISFIEQCLNLRERPEPTRTLGEKKLPELQEDAFDPSILARLRDQFADEQLVAVNVRLALPRQQGTPDLGEMVVFVQRQAETERADTYYVREGMTITKLNSRAGLRGIRAFVMVDQFLTGTTCSNPLAALLGDSEGPAHEDWDTSEERPGKIWTAWKGRVKFCRRIVDALVEVLAPPSRVADFELLSDFFSIERTRAPQAARQPGDNGRGVPDFASITTTPRWYRLEGRRGGFRVVPSNDAKPPAHPRLKLSVAYDLPTGNPLAKWSPFDFTFGSETELQLKGKQVKVKKTAGNILLLDIQASDFSFSADGFDVHRDVFVRIDEFEADQTSEVE